VCRAIKEKCVPLSRNCLIPSGYASEERFWKKLQDQGVHLGNGMVLCTADGLALDGYKDGSLARGLASFARLSPAQRTPGAIKIEDRGPINPGKGPPQPPSGGLIARVYIRGLERNLKNELFAPKKMVLGISNTTIDAEPNRDFLWLTETERKSLTPPKAAKGDRFPLAASICNRLIRFHLVDGSCGLPEAWQPEQVRSAETTLTIEEVSSSQIRLRLDGSVRFDKDALTWAGFQLLGLLSFDTKKQAVNRFDVVALGQFSPKERTAGKTKELGIAFELAGNSPIDRLPPFGTHLVGPEWYFKTER